MKPNLSAYDWLQRELTIFPNAVSCFPQQSFSILFIYFNLTEQAKQDLRPRLLRHKACDNMCTFPPGEHMDVGALTQL